DTDFFSLPRPRIFGHRGAAGELPENTMVSFERAARDGAMYLELDVHMSRDEQIIVSHDGGLARACGLDALIREMSWAEIQAADAGYMLTFDGGSTFPFRGRSIKIPRLIEVLGAFRELNYIVEIKQTEPSLVPHLLAVVDAVGLRRRGLIASGFAAPLGGGRTLAPPIPTKFSYGGAAEFLQAMAGYRPGYEPPGAALQVPAEYQGWKLVTPQSVEFAHRAGVEIHVWTVNDESEMYQLLDGGVDGLIS